MAPLTPQYLLAAVARLTGDAGRRGNHVVLFRVLVTAADGKRCSVILRVSEKKAFRSSLHQIADSLRVERDAIEEVLETWTPDQLRAYLSTFPSDVLDSPAALRRFRD